MHGLIAAVVLKVLVAFGCWLARLEFPAIVSFGLPDVIATAQFSAHAEPSRLLPLSISAAHCAFIMDVIDCR